MRTLSFWAKHHPLYARIIIIISRCLLLCIAYFLGTRLVQSGVELSPLWLCFFVVVFFITGAVYPREPSTKNYAVRKRSDLIIACCSFLLMICVANDLNKPLPFYQTAQAVVPTDPLPYKYSEAKKLLEQFEKGEKKKFSLKEKRIIRREFNYQLLQYAKAKISGRKTDAGQTALIILACIAAVGLLYLVAALACSLSCNGSDVAAVIVGILGTAAIIWGLIAVIRSINHKKPKTK
jgi:hypothetical protein